MLRPLLWLSIAPVGLYAFRDTSPLVAWTSLKSPTLEALSSNGHLLMNTKGDGDTLLGGREICQYNTIVIFEQPGLRGADLKGLPASSYIAQQLRSASSSALVPYTFPSVSPSIARDIASRCEASLLELRPGHARPTEGLPGKYVIAITLPEIDGDRWTRMNDLDEAMEGEIANLSLDSAPEFFVLVGTSSSLEERQGPASLQTSTSYPEDLVKAETSAPQPSKKPSASPKGGIFKRYQLLTPGLITIFLIAFGLLFPLLYLVIGALASIKSPIVSESFKPPTSEKKNQ